MMTLLRFHIRYSSKSIVFFIVLAIALGFLNSNQVININIVSLVTFFTIYIPSLCIAHLLSEPFSKLIRTFPITFKQFVKSSYLYIIILYNVMIIPVFIVLANQYFKGNITVFALCYTLGIFAFSIVTTGGALKAHFKHPANSKSFSGSDMFFYILFVFITHTLLCFLFSLFDFILVGALITPIICFVIFYKQYKASVKLYEQAEFL
ncbi:hypothetical protein LZ480_03700 [Solibacillus sp. MA9]|uniref:Uncharacterized protein n=1 Tax=Solibacillus palustris TaxID=2908203 RepID=A0ABS9UA12_9BACL|nr:hypothetical protein [Solibacillus sp. MA9]MCH7320985.1 hypothetical protein [Solibacillus sp. MA9]